MEDAAVSVGDGARDDERGVLLTSTMPSLLRLL